MTKFKRVFLVMIAIVLLGATVVYATNDNTIIITDPDEQQTQNDVNTNTNSTVIDNGNTSTYNNTTGNLPQTGENDYIVILTIAVFAVSAVYAYKKIRDYKNI